MPGSVLFNPPPPPPPPPALPPAQTPEQVQPYEPRARELFQPVLFLGRGMGQIKITSAYRKLLSFKDLGC